MRFGVFPFDRKSMASNSCTATFANTIESNDICISCLLRVRSIDRSNADPTCRYINIIVIEQIVVGKIRFSFSPGYRPIDLNTFILRSESLAEKYLLSVCIIFLVWIYRDLIKSDLEEDGMRPMKKQRRC